MRLYGLNNVKEYGHDGKRPFVMSGYEALYAGALPARRSGPLYGAFPYPTKTLSETIALLIAAHTVPGDTVFDGFAGSGTTGLAALLCEAPTPELLQAARQLPVKLQWGARDAVLYEVGALGAFIGETLTNPPEPPGLSSRRRSGPQGLPPPKTAGCTTRMTSHATLARCDTSYGLTCSVAPCCQSDVSLWDRCVSRTPAAIASRFVCRHCSSHVSLDGAERITDTTPDEVLATNRQVRVRRPVWLYGKTGSRCWSRPVDQNDVELLSRIDGTSLPDSVPVVAIPWGDLYRRGYHQGITHLHHFYTRRNLMVFTRDVGPHQFLQRGDDCCSPDSGSSVTTRPMQR